METYSYNKKELDNHENIANVIFGNRFYADQSLFEYLIEFLLIFNSAKYPDCQTGKLRFHEKGEPFEYYAETMMGLRRFIFYDGSKKDTSIPLDENAYEGLIDAIKDNMDGNLDKDKLISAIQDLLRGYAVVLKKRTWCAQQILPICPEMIFCEAMPNQKKRKLNVENAFDPKIDSSFDFTKRNYLARGGELYYLHIMQALDKDSTSDRRNQLNVLLQKLLTRQSKQLSQLCRYIQDTWYVLLEENNKPNNNPIKSYQRYNLEYIPANAYLDCGDKTINELINFLSSDFQEIKKLEILAQGIMFQVMRMMYSAVCNKLGKDKNPWIVDMTNNTSKITKKISTKSLRDVEDDFKECINKTAKESGYKGTDLVNIIKKTQKNSIDIFKSKGKEIRCIIPISGSFERFTLTEDLLRFLVLSLVKPEEKITYDMFLDRLYTNCDIVVGANEYSRAYKTLSDDQLTEKNNLFENQKCFQNYLKATGFLKELSDSTSLVINPYKQVE